MLLKRDHLSLCQSKINLQQSKRSKITKAVTLVKVMMNLKTKLLAAHLIKMITAFLIIYYLD